MVIYINMMEGEGDDECESENKSVYSLFGDYVGIGLHLKFYTYTE